MNKLLGVITQVLVTSNYTGIEHRYDLLNKPIQDKKHDDFPRIRQELLKMESLKG